MTHNTYRGLSVMHREAQWKQGVTFPNGLKKTHMAWEVHASPCSKCPGQHGYLQAHAGQWSPEPSISWEDTSLPSELSSPPPAPGNHHSLSVCLSRGIIFGPVAQPCPRVAPQRPLRGSWWSRPVEAAEHKLPKALCSANCTLRITGLVGKMGLVAGCANPAQLGKQRTSKRHWGDLVAEAHRQIPVAAGWHCR